MTITIFVEPKCLGRFLEITNVLRTLPIDNEYVFQPKDIRLSEELVSNWLWINMDMAEYLQLKYCSKKLSK